MPERSTAEAQLARILEIIPRAARSSEGVRLGELAALLEVTPEQVVEDLQEVYTRAFHHPAGGGGEDVQILIEADQVDIWTTGELRRPTALTSREALALHLGLRILAAETADEQRREQIGALSRRLERELGSAPPEALAAQMEISTAADGEDRIRPLLVEAATERRRVRIRYVKPGSAEPDTREIEPYLLAIAEGSWYVIGCCCRSGAPRTFRLDRVLAAEALEHGFEVPAGFDPSEFVRDGRVYRADEEIEVAVRYSAGVARWITERTGTPPERDGAVVIRHRVADPAWVVRHVLQYGPDAQVLEPQEVRERVRSTALQLLAVRTGGPLSEGPGSVVVSHPLPDT